MMEKVEAVWWTAGVNRMRRIGSVMLALLAGVLMPVLIWVALFTVVRGPLLRTLERAAFATLALLAGIVYPFLVWVGLAVAVKEWSRRWSSLRTPVRTVGEVLAAAGLAIQWDGPPELRPIPLFLPMPISEVRRVLAEAGLRGNIG